MRHALQMVAGAILLAVAAWLFVLAFGDDAAPVGPAPPQRERGAN